MMDLYDEEQDPEVLMQKGIMPNTPRDPEKEIRDMAKVKAFLQPRMQQEMAASNAQRDVERQAGLSNLFMQAANQAGTIGGKSASAQPLVDFNTGLVSQGKEQLARDASLEDRKQKLLEYFGKQRQTDEAAKAMQKFRDKQIKQKDEELRIRGIEAGKKGEKEPSEGERKQAAFATRAKSANTAYEQYLAENPDAAEMSIKDYQLLEKAPIAGSSFISPKAKMIKQLEKEFIGSILRPETGAAASDEEWSMYGGKYFPRPGDTPEILARKKQVRQQDIDTMATMAGKAAGQIKEPAPLAVIDRKNDITPAASTTAASSTTPGRKHLEEMTPEEIDAELAEHQKAGRL